LENLEKQKEEKEALAVLEMNKETKTIIGICGNARCGKDTMAELIQEVLTDIGIKSKKINLADSLKDELRDFVDQTLGIDVYTNNTEEKSIIRPLLVTWGTHVRRKLDEDIWLKKAVEKMQDECVYIIPDIRYPNEMDWLRQHNSYCIFIDRIDGDILIPPANDDEALNNPILKENSDFQLTWQTVGDENKKMLKQVAVEVLEKTIDEKVIKLWTQTFH
jgi:ABC-type dipeptide/oligopeptide/nickel transport system ATPase component